MKGHYGATAELAALGSASLGMVFGGLVWGLTGSKDAGLWTFGAVVVGLACTF